MTAGGGTGRAAQVANFRARYGDWAVVTGASDGIGRAFAHALAERGLNLVLVARRGALLAGLADELSAAHMVECRVLAADLGKAVELERLLSETDSLQVGMLVASAGFGTSGEFVARDLCGELDMLDVNCRAATWLAHHYGRKFVAQRRGGIVLMSSLLAFQGVPHAAHYAATKAYIQVLAEGLRPELGRHGVDVIASAPGPVTSGFASRAGMQMGAASLPAVVAADTLAALGRQTTVRPGWLSTLLEASLSPLPRWGRTAILQRVMGGMTAHQRHDPVPRGDGLR